MVDLRQPNEITLYCDLTRLLPETDPLSRQIMMSHGTFLELLDLAARRKGLRADIELFPQGQFGPDQLDTRPVARIRLAPDAENVSRRTRCSTNSEAPHQPRGVPAAGAGQCCAVRAIADSVAPHSIRVGFVGAAQPDVLQQHRAIAMDAWRIELVTPRTIMESYKVLRSARAKLRSTAMACRSTRPWCGP